MYLMKKSQLGLLSAFVVGMLAVWFAPFPEVHLIVIWLIALLACGIVRFDLIHPYCWFSLTFALYNTAYTILYVCNYDRTAGYSSMNAVYTLTAMVVVLMVVTPVKVRKEASFQKNVITNFTINNWAFYLLAGLSVLFAVILQARGYTGKKAMQAANDICYTLGVHVVRWMMVMMLIQVCTYKCGSWRKNIKYFGISTTAALFLGLFTGERDIIFRAVLVCVFVMFYFGIIRKGHLVAMVPAGVLLMNASVYFKYFFLNGVINTRNRETGGVLYQFLMTDFYATGRNTQYLLNAEWTKGFFGMKLFFNELLRGIVPSPAYINPSTWYNYEVYPGSFKGQAFSLVGFGHVIAGIAGVVFVFVLLGLFIRYAYRNHKNSMYTLVFYLYSVSIVMGCYRQTLNTVVNMSIKGALIGILMSKLISAFTIKKKMGQTL